MLPMTPTQRLIRIYKNLDLHHIQSHLLIWGELTASCSQCNNLGLKFDTLACPQCHTEFKYIAFRNIKDHLPKIVKLNQERPDIVLVDYDDFKRLSGALKAQEFLK